MDIWIIQDGVKKGPIHDFEIRAKIESGELSSDTPAWHEGLDSWRPLIEILLFAREFDRLLMAKEAEKAAEELLKSQPPPQATPTPSAEPHLIRRFWARWFDLYLFAGFWWFGMWALGRDIGGIMNNPWIILFHYIPWFALEAVLLHRYGTTPGKWLLGIKVTNDDGALLSLAESTRRAGRVFFLGIGFGWIPLALICHLISVLSTRRMGRPLWDHAGGHSLKTTSLSPLRLVVYVFSLYAALQLQLIVLAPHLMKYMEETYPAMSEQIKKNPPWHLPVRK